MLVLGSILLNCIKLIIVSIMVSFELFYLLCWEADINMRINDFFCIHLDDDFNGKI